MTPITRPLRGVHERILGTMGLIQSRGCSTISAIITDSSGSMPALLDLNIVIMANDANRVAASMEIAKAIFDSPSSEIEPSTVITMGIEDPESPTALISTS